MSRKLKVPCVAAHAKRRIDIARRYAVLPTAIAAAIAWLDATSAQSQSMRTYVSGLGRDSQACTAQSPCKTFQAALAKTAQGGQIYVLDSAEYGPITITKSISIIAGGKASGVLAAAGTSGITVAAGPADTVTLQGLTIDGAGSGANGVLFTSGAALNIKNSLIRGFQTGLAFQPTSLSALSVQGAKVTNNTTGVSIETASSSATRGVLSDVQIVGNGVGLSAKGQSTGEASVLLNACLISNNDTVGIRSAGYSVVALANCDVSNNALGLEASNTGAALRIAGTSVAGNGIGSQTSNGGQITSAQSNFSQSALVQAAQLPPPTPPGPTGTASDPFNTWNGNNESGENPSIVKNIVTDFGARCDGVADDNAAFTAFNSWAKVQTTPIELTIPPGSVCMFSRQTLGNYIAKGVKKLLVVGYGATFSDNNGAGNGWFLGGTGVVQDNLHSARLETVSAGSTCVTLRNPAQTSLFEAGRYALISGFDMMGYGFPPNPHFYEYVRIRSVTVGTGNICFDEALKNTYKSNWPVYFAGNLFEADQGGPATLYALDPSWDTEVEYRGLTFKMEGFQTYAIGRSITYRDVEFTGSACAVPTQNKQWNVINSRFLNCSMEVDKLIDTVTLDRVTIRRIEFQSSSVNVFNLMNSTVTEHIMGTPKKFFGYNITTPYLGVGAFAYGRTDEVSCTNCVIGQIEAKGFVVNDATYTMSDGVITVPNSQGPLTWAIPGSNIVWTGRFIQEGPTFQVLDVTQDATNTYVRTSLSGGFPPAPRYQGSALGVRTHPAPKFTCANCTGGHEAVMLSKAPPGAPLGSYFRRTYTADTPATVAYLFGTLTSTKIDVTTAYAGSSPLNFNLDGPFVIGADGATVNTWAPTVNPKLANLATAPRTITGVATLNGQLGDNLVSSASSWVSSNQVTPKFNVIPMDMGATSVTVEIITDQGIVIP